eukprot:136453_1
MATRLEALKLYKQILRIIPRSCKNDLEMQMAGRFSLREYYENRRNETDTAKIKEYLEEGNGVVHVLTNELMQVEITERDQYGNPTHGVADIRPELLQNPPPSNPISAQELSRKKKSKTKSDDS